MYLLLNLSAKDRIHLALFNESHIADKEVNGRNRELLAVLDDFLVEQCLNKKSIQGIMVVLGAGSFTSTRIAAVAANAFAFVSGIPLFSLAPSDIGRVQDFIPALLRQTRRRYVSATYSGEPHLC